MRRPDCSKTRWQAARRGAGPAFEMRRWQSRRRCARREYRSEGAGARRGAAVCAARRGAQIFGSGHRACRRLPYRMIADLADLDAGEERLAQARGRGWREAATPIDAAAARSFGEAAHHAGEALAAGRHGRTAGAEAGARALHRARSPPMPRAARPKASIASNSTCRPIRARGRARS